MLLSLLGSPCQLWDGEQGFDRILYLVLCSVKSFSAVNEDEVFGYLSFGGIIISREYPCHNNIDELYDGQCRFDSFLGLVLHGVYSVGNIDKDELQGFKTKFK